MLLTRATTIAESLRPMDHDEAEKAASILGAMLNGWRQLRGVDDDDATFTIDVILGGMRDAPLWAVELACQKFRAGTVKEIISEFNPNFPPNDNQIIFVVNSFIGKLRQREKSARLLLAAKIEPPPLPTPPKIERQNLIKYADVPSGVVPSTPPSGNHMARVLADIAARKGKECTEPPITSPTTTESAGVGQTATGHQVVSEPDGLAGDAHTGNP